MLGGRTLRTQLYARGNAQPDQREAKCKPRQKCKSGGRRWHGPQASHATLCEAGRAAAAGRTDGATQAWPAARYDWLYKPSPTSCNIGRLMDQCGGSYALVPRVVFDPRDVRGAK